MRPASVPFKSLKICLVAVIVAAAWSAPAFAQSATIDAVPVEQAFAKTTDGAWADTSIEASSTRKEVEDALNRLSGQPEPYPDVAVSGKTGADVATTLEAAAESPTTERAATGLWRMRAAAALVPPIEAMPPVELAAGTFLLGW